MKFTLFASNCRGDEENCLYPKKVQVDSSEKLKAAVAFDHVCATYRNSYRGKKSFIKSDVIPMDIDNDHTDDPALYITPEKLDELFPDVSYCIATSRNHNRPKGSKSAAPRYHVYFPIPECMDADEYASMKVKLQKAYPFFDDNALDAGRFLYGAETKEVVWHEGWMSITDEIEDMMFPETETDEKPAEPHDTGIIHEGNRNNTMHKFANRILKRYGISEKAHALFKERAKKCSPPLGDDELATIWNSAEKFYRTKVMTQEGYVEPDVYNTEFTGSLKPDDYSDIGQARVLSREYGDELIYTSETDFLRYDGTVWVEDKQLAVGAAVEFLDVQLQDASDSIFIAKAKLKDAGISDDAIEGGVKAIAKEVDTPEKADALTVYASALQYFAFVMKRRDMKYITSAMNVAKALLNHSINEMDQNPYLLNTPEGTIDLVKGLDGIREHKASDLITKICSCNPGDKGEDLWKDSLNVFFLGDEALIKYVQRVVGMAAVGKVYQEHLIIAYGDGANGKSTFWNTIARALGTYSGKISAEVLAVGNKRNAKPEMAELKGKRLIIASEMEEGMRLNTGMVKQLCSIDPIQAEKKYEKPFSFVPTHTLVLYTNHLPRVGANDDGIWRRLIVIPFNAKITGKSDVKNFADHLFSNAGPAIMKWIVEGAKEAIALDFKWPLPKQVQTAISEYREQNDWFATFLEDCCEVGEDYTEKSGAFYDEYRNYCVRVGEYTRNSADFYAAVEKAGLRRKRTANARLIVGARLKSEFA